MPPRLGELLDDLSSGVSGMQGNLRAYISLWKVEARVSGCLGCRSKRSAVPRSCKPSGTMKPDHLAICALRRPVLAELFRSHPEEQHDNAQTRLPKGIRETRRARDAKRIEPLGRARPSQSWRAAKTSVGENGRPIQPRRAGAEDDAARHLPARRLELLPDEPGSACGRAIKETKGATRENGRWKIVDHRSRQFPFYSAGAVVTPWMNLDQTSEAGRYMQAVKQFLRTGDAELLKLFEPARVLVTSTAGSTRSSSTKTPCYEPDHRRTRR